MEKALDFYTGEIQSVRGGRLVQRKWRMEGLRMRKRAETGGREGGGSMGMWEMIDIPPLSRFSQMTKFLTIKMPENINSVLQHYSDHWLIL